MCPIQHYMLQYQHLFHLLELTILISCVKTINIHLCISQFDAIIQLAQCYSTLYHIAHFQTIVTLMSGRSATCPTCRLRVPCQFHFPTKYSSTLWSNFVLFLHVLLYPHFTTTDLHISLSTESLLYLLHTANATSWTGAQASRAMPGINSEVVWSPTFGAEQGSEYLPICLCVVPGLLGEVWF
jgi:hypothetical protein